MAGHEVRDLNNMLIRIHALLNLASQGHVVGSMATYLYDATETRENPDAPLQFLGASKVTVGDTGNGTDKNIIFLTEEDSQYKNLTDYDIKYEEEIEVGGRVWRAVVVPVDDSFETDLTAIILSGCLIFVAALALALWMLHNMRRSMKMQEVMATAAAEAAILSSLFPEGVKQRLLEDAAAKAKKKEANPIPSGFYSGDITHEKLTHYLTVEGIFGSKPIAELYPSASLFFADLVGFTAWSSVRDPSQVFTLLEIIYHSFDNIAKRRKIFKGKKLENYVEYGNVMYSRLYQFLNGCFLVLG